LLVIGTGGARHEIGRTDRNVTIHYRTTRIRLKPSRASTSFTPPAYSKKRLDS
jgi:hypothetical protein